VINSLESLKIETLNALKVTFLSFNLFVEWRTLREIGRDPEQADLTWRISFNKGHELRESFFDFHA